jgi:hypothetical protein
MKWITEIRPSRYFRGTRIKAGFGRIVFSKIGGRAMDKQTPGIQVLHQKRC